MAKKEVVAPKKEDAIVMVDKNAIAVPDFLMDYAGKGTEHLTKTDLLMPRLALAQGLSPQLNPDKPEYVDGLRLGDAFNKVTGRIYGRGPWEIAIIRADPPRWVEFFPREEGGGVKDPNVPHGDPRTQWRADGRKPVATMFYDYIVLFLEDQEPIALSFKATGIKTAKLLNTLIKLRGQIPLFMGRYSMKAVMTKGAKGDYAVLQIQNAGHVEDHATLRFLANQFNAFKDKPLNIDREPGEDDDVDVTTDTSGM